MPYRPGTPGGPSTAVMAALNGGLANSHNRIVPACVPMTAGKFIQREGNNLAPGTLPANIQAVYDVCRAEGVYEG